MKSKNLFVIMLAALIAALAAPLGAPGLRQLCWCIPVF
jgi:hypothetical protein